MKTTLSLLTLAMALVAQTAALAGGPPGGEGNPPGPCKEIAATCKAAGFTPGDWKKGDGLWYDCVDPIIQGKTVVPGATKPLPAVDPKIVAACKARHPKYGTGKVGSIPPTTATGSSGN